MSYCFNDLRSVDFSIKYRISYNNELDLLLFNFFDEFSFELVLNIIRFHILFGIVVKKLLNETASMVLKFCFYKHYKTIIIYLDNLVIRKIIKKVFVRAMSDKERD